MTSTSNDHSNVKPEELVTGSIWVEKRYPKGVVLTVVSRDEDRVGITFNHRDKSYVTYHRAYAVVSYLRSSSMVRFIDINEDDLWE